MIFAKVRTLFHINDSYLPKPFKFIVSGISKIRSKRIRIAVACQDQAEAYSLTRYSILLPPVREFHDLCSPGEYANREPGVLRMLNLGNYTPGKRQRILLSFIADQVKKFGPNWPFIELELSFYGVVLSNHSQYFNALSEIAADINNSSHSVRVMLNRKSDSISDLFQKSDCLISCSLKEGMPTVFLEAISAQKPIVTPSVSGIKQVQALLSGSDQLMLLHEIDSFEEVFHENFLLKLKRPGSFSKALSDHLENSITPKAVSLATKSVYRKALE